MKILLVCAGGMSTGLLMKKMEKYWEERGEDNSINAVGLSEYMDVYKDYDIIAPCNALKNLFDPNFCPNS